MPVAVVLFLPSLLKSNWMKGADEMMQEDGGNEIAAVYDLAANTYVPFHIAEHPFCAGGNSNTALQYY